AAPAAVAAAAIVAALAAGRFAGRREERAAPAAQAEPSRRVRALRATLTAVGDGVTEALVLLREANLVLIAGLLAYLVFDVMILWATFHAIGSPPPVGILAMGYLIGELGGLIPIPGGLGGIDAGLVGTLVLYHVPITAAAGAVLLYRAIALWVPGLVGGGAFVILRRTLRREAGAIEVCAPQTEMEIIGVGRAVIRPDA
ncbi:MAG: lysylphosphatidylglycerol synthase transmembrane domain-containing protein, partial [Solirubrobacteraceae bacterium]